MKRKYSGIFFLIFCLGPYLEAQKNPPKITLVPLAGPVYMLQGGGGNIGIAELKAFRDMLSDSADLVRRQMKAGKTLDAIKAAGLPEKLAPWANGFLKASQWLELVYQSLKKGAVR